MVEMIKPSPFTSTLNFAANILCYGMPDEVVSSLTTVLLVYIYNYPSINTSLLVIRGKGISGKTQPLLKFVKLPPTLPRNAYLLRK